MRRNRGFTLLETLVGSFVFLVVALAAYRAFGTLMDAVAASQSKVAASALANEQFEIIRNLPYTDVGIVAGLPAGKVPREQALVRDGYSFSVLTTIRSSDDPFDGTIGGNPSDTSPADYKLADLDITCNNCKIFTPLKFTTLVAPRALETASSNGALFIQVYDSAGAPVPDASVHIVNTQTDPDTIIDEVTDSGGWLKIVDAPPGTNAYNISATKAGYTLEQTYPYGGGAGPDPIKPDSTVVLQQVTQIGFQIDRESSLSVTTVDGTCVALPSVGFSLTGTKLIGNPSVLKYPTQNFTTDASGAYSLSDMEWDTYGVLLTSGTYDLAGTSLLPSFALNPNENKVLQLVAVPHASYALLVTVKDSQNAPINGATVHLEKSGFDETKIAGSGPCSTPGQVFWNGLTSGSYTLTVSYAGYQDSVSTVDMSSAWQERTITLNP
ncbi:MAG: carboxypeptidase regulatory-like domain-containing protein [Patescibacteria group bacterium]